MGRYLEVQAIRADFFAVAGGRGAAPSGEGAAPKNREFWNLGSCFSDFFGILGSLDFFGIFGILGFWDFGIFLGSGNRPRFRPGIYIKNIKKVLASGLRRGILRAAKGNSPFCFIQKNPNLEKC